MWTPRMCQIREYVMNLYPNPTWHAKVAAMPDSQVYAIYRSKEESKKYLQLNNVPVNAPEEEPHQITIWEYLNSKGE